jgi:hypothetical protein
MWVHHLPRLPRREDTTQVSRTLRDEILVEELRRIHAEN